MWGCSSGVVESVHLTPLDAGASRAAGMEGQKCVALQQALIIVITCHFDSYL